jgi:hypothetical protein
MNVVLVNPPNHRYDVTDLAPPLSLLCLASVAKSIGASTAIVDLNLDSCRGSLPIEIEEFYVYALRRIFAFNPDVIGFTSMGLNSHVCLELADRAKRLSPSVRTVFGGPHFSAIGNVLSESLPCIDYVVCGDGVQAFKMLLSKLIKGEAVVNRIIQRVTNIDDLANSPGRITAHPWDGYHDISLEEYFSINPRHTLDFESGRGCKYNCKFCYSPNHWNERYEFRIDQITADVIAAYDRGARHLFFVQDNFLNDQEQARALCSALKPILPRPTWHCYATLPDIHVDSTPEMLAESGCISVYIGVDAITTRQQQLLGKHFTRNLEHCLDKVRALAQASVKPTCAIMLDPFSFNTMDLDVSLFWAARFRAVGSSLSFHLLTPYFGTPIAQVIKRDLHVGSLRTRLMFDCADVVLENSYARRFPLLFPFHTYPCEPDRFLNGLLFVYFAQHLLDGFPYEVLDLANMGTSISRLINNVIGRLALTPCQLPDQLSIRDAGIKCFESLLRQEYDFVNAS